MIQIGHARQQIERWENIDKKSCEKYEANRSVPCMNVRKQEEYKGNHN